ncbi:hypothetical protein PILCRDRAFT_15431 [Piloderma croceum F 1598]|uniref:Uncharacterized protein n=1 Tax=Piloderma croceum (strain F 1598) TaxID=765440 RepID=A0A0C3EZ19_PILCF|nr:hypothetical protein PILCRDRAFT_15431 [Piloderma croceum F 1598]
MHPSIVSGLPLGGSPLRLFSLSISLLFVSFRVTASSVLLSHFNLASVFFIYLPPIFPYAYSVRQAANRKSPLSCTGSTPWSLSVISTVSPVAKSVGWVVTITPSMTPGRRRVKSPIPETTPTRRKPSPPLEVPSDSTLAAAEVEVVPADKPSDVPAITVDPASAYALAQSQPCWEQQPPMRRWATIPDGRW